MQEAAFDQFDDVRRSGHDEWKLGRVEAVYAFTDIFREWTKRILKLPLATFRSLQCQNRQEHPA